MFACFKFRGRSCDMGCIGLCNVQDEQRGRLKGRRRGQIFEQRHEESPISNINYLFSCLDNELEPEGKPGVSSILDWVFAEFPFHQKGKLYSDFWQEIIDRCKEDDVSGQSNHALIGARRRWQVSIQVSSWRYIYIIDRFKVDVLYTAVGIKISSER